MIPICLLQQGITVRIKLRSDQYQSINKRATLSPIVGAGVAPDGGVVPVKFKVTDIECRVQYSVPPASYMSAFVDKFMQQGKMLYPCVEIQTQQFDIASTNSYIDLSAAGSYVESSLLTFYNSGEASLGHTGNVDLDGWTNHAITYRDLIMSSKLIANVDEQLVKSDSLHFALPVE